MYNIFFRNGIIGMYLYYIYSSSLRLMYHSSYCLSVYCISYRDTWDVPHLRIWLRTLETWCNSAKDELWLISIYCHMFESPASFPGGAQTESPSKRLKTLTVKILSCLRPCSLESYVAFSQRGCIPMVHTV